MPMPKNFVPAEAAASKPKEKKVVAEDTSKLTMEQVMMRMEQNGKKELEKEKKK